MNVFGKIISGSIAFLGTDPSLKSNSYKILLFIVFLAIHQYFIDTGSVHVDNLEFQLVPGDFLAGRSEERRVGKECRSRWSPYH